MKLKAIDFFCGMGGATSGISQAGFDIIKAYDLFEDAIRTHKHNMPKIDIEQADITKLSGEDIPYADYMHFSPPCQSFSTSGSNKGVDDLRGQLIYEPIRIVRLKKPKAFTVENVKGLTTGKNRDVLDSIIEEFERIGYKVTWDVLNAYDYGVAQNRERLFIVGIREDLEIRYEFPDKTPNNKVLWDVIGNINDNFGLPRHGQGLIDKIKHVPQGGNVLDIPEEIRPKSFKNSYSRLRWEQIPPTITRNYRVPSSANCIHPIENRGLSDKEALLIQSFDSSWEVKGRRVSEQIGNSVPPKMMEIIAKSLISTISNNN